MRTAVTTLLALAVLPAPLAADEVLRPNGGQFSVRFPGKPKENTQTTKTPIGDLEVYTATYATSDGRVLTGIISEETTESLTLKTPEEDVLLAKSDIEARKQSLVSMMPEGLFEKLSDEEIRDLIAYLDSAKQVPLPGDSAEAQSK